MVILGKKGRPCNQHKQRLVWSMPPRKLHPAICTSTHSTYLKFCRLSRLNLNTSTFFKNCTDISDKMLLVIWLITRYIANRVPRGNGGCKFHANYQILRCFKFTWCRYPSVIIENEASELNKICGMA